MKKKNYNFDIFPTRSQICTSLPPKFWGNPKFDLTHLCVYYQSWIMQSLVFLSYFSKVIEEKAWGFGGGWLVPSPWYRKG